MEHNINQAREFLHLLTGDVNTPVMWQIFYDVKGEEKKQELARHFQCSLDEALPLIKWSQERFCGIYCCINETDGEGRENRNITRFRTLFADFDGIAEPTWSLTPHFIQKRDETHGHAFWLISDVTDSDTFMRLQRRIAIHHGTDKQVSDPARVVRVAGFNHYKNPNTPAQYAVTDDNTDGEHKYTVAEIEQSFPLTAQQDAELNAWIESRKGLTSGSGYENNERYNEQFMNWLDTTAPPAIKGHGRSFGVIKVASYAHDYGIPIQTATELMWNHFNPRCIPPYDITERESKHDLYVQRAYQYSTSEAGCKTAIGKFSSLRAENPLPTPVGGWEGDAARRPDLPKTTTIAESMVGQELIAPVDHEGTTKEAFGDRYTEDEAINASAGMDEKTPHYDLAKILDGILYHGRNLIRCDKIFYAFNGKVWQVIHDDVIKSAVMRYYKKFKPTDTFTRGVFNVLCDLVNVASVEQNTWLKPDSIDPANLIIYKNGILDYTNQEAGLMPHTSDLFTYNSLSYNYNPNAKCPVWLGFLSEVFQNDTLLIEMMRQWVAYCMTGDARYQKMAVLLGKSRAGKGVITETIRALIGKSNTVAPPLSNFTKDGTLYAMSRASLILVPDAHTVGLSNRSGVQVNLKAITGNDPLDYHVMYKGTQTSMFAGKIMLSSNEMPHFDDSSGALNNRMLVFPFNISFKGREDTTLKGRISKELEGIAQWALESLPTLRAKGGFVESESSRLEREEIREDMFPLAQFVNAACELNTQYTCTVAELFAAYRLWCTQTGVNKPMTENQMNKVFKNCELNIQSARPVINGKRIRTFNGISVILGKFPAVK